MQLGSYLLDQTKDEFLLNLAALASARDTLVFLAGSEKETRSGLSVDVIAAFCGLVLLGATPALPGDIEAPCITRYLG